MALHRSIERYTRAVFPESCDHWEVHAVPRRPAGDTWLDERLSHAQFERLAAEQQLYLATCTDGEQPYDERMLQLGPSCWASVAITCVSGPESCDGIAHMEPLICDFATY